jgi:hypothetical protein
MTTPDRKYPTLGANFLKGSVAGQIKSIQRTRETQPEKLAEFNQAIACRDIPIRASQLTPASRTGALRTAGRSTAGQSACPLAGRSLAVWA